MKLLHKFRFLISSLALTGLLFSAPLRAEVTVYIVAPGDTLWRIAHEQLKSQHSWQQLMTFNKIADHAQLEVGQAVRLPQDWMKAFEPLDESITAPAHLPAAASIPAGKKFTVTTNTGEGAEAADDMASMASITAVAATFGDVSLISEDQVSKLKVDTVLADGSRVRTGPNSSVNILLNDGSMLVLLAETEVVLNKPLELLQGDLEYTASNYDEQVLVTTQAGSVSAKQARFRVATNNDGKKMRLEMEQGSATIIGNDRSRAITAGIVIQLEAGKALPEPRQGLMRPDVANIAKRGVNGKINLKWPESRDAKAYRAQLVFARDTYLVLRDVIVDKPQVSWSNVSPGRYNVRLRSIDDNGLEGLNANLSFSVQGILNPPPSHSPRDKITLPTNRPWIAWGRIPEAYSYDLQVAKDAAFSVELQDLTYRVDNYYRYTDALPVGDYYWRVRSVSRKRVKSSYGETRMFTIK